MLSEFKSSSRVMLGFSPCRMRKTELHNSSAKNQSGDLSLSFIYGCSGQVTSTLVDFVPLLVVADIPILVVASFRMISAYLVY